MSRTILVSAVCLLLVLPAWPQARAPQPPPAEPEANHANDALMKAIDDVQWRQKLGDIAEITKVRLTGPPAAREPNPTAQGAGNPLI
ncbi:MAG: S9 family peptidase, partial [Acidobacteria bacterium]|nr:S9 family peptidase [Acidobacteriota bacterium]